MKSIFATCIAFAFAMFFAAPGFALQGNTLRIGCYNLQDKPVSAADDADIRAILAEIGSQQVNGVARSIDLLAFQEGPQSAGSYSFLENDFETVYGGDFEIVFGTARFGCRTGFVYNADRLSLISSSSIDNLGFTHLPVLATFRPVGGSAEDEFSAITLHLKAGSTISDDQQREFEAFRVGQLVNSLPPDQPVIMLGDLNMKGSDEPAWPELVSAGARETINAPLGVRVANWNDSRAYHPFHSQDVTGQLGGMDDRFDVMLVTSAFFDNQGIEFNPGSLVTIGNNGTHSLNSPITSGTGASAVQQNLIDFSDHLPVFGEFGWGVSRTLPVNTLNLEATENWTVRPSGPRTGTGGSAEFQVEGSNNGNFAAFGVIDCDLTTVLNSNLSATRVQRAQLDLTQINAGFTSDGAYSVYLASTTATSLPIGSGVSYQSGNNGLACLPAALSADAILLARYPGIHHTPGGNNLPDGTLDSISLTGSRIDAAIVSAINSNGRVRLLLVPEHPSTAATFAGRTNTTFSGPAIGGLYDARTSRLFSPRRSFDW